MDLEGGLGARIKCNMGGMGSVLRNSLFTCKGKGAYILPSPESTLVGASSTGVASVVFMDFLCFHLNSLNVFLDIRT